MRPSRVHLVALAVALAGACKKDTTAPQRTKSKVLQRTATKKGGWPYTGGWPVAGDPTPGPPLSEVFANAKWFSIDPGAGPDGMPEVVEPPLVSTQDGAYGQRVLAIKRAAFRRRVVKPGDSAPLDDDAIDDLDLEPPPHVFVVGPRPCVATPGITRVIVLDAFGRELQLRHAMVGCGPGPHAPIGFAAERIPFQIAWVPATCDDHDEGWHKAEVAIGHTVEAPARVGKIVFGESPIVHVLAGDDAFHLAITAERGGPIVRHVEDLDPRAVSIACEHAAPQHEPQPQPEPPADQG